MEHRTLVPRAPAGKAMPATRAECRAAIDQLHRDTDAVKAQIAAADLVELSRATVARIRENLALAVAYNAVAVPLAIAGVIGPLGAAIAMSLSSLAVTGNAIRLLRWTPRA